MKDYAVNVIVKNMLSQVYDEGYSVTHVDSIVDHKRDDSSVYNSKKYFVTRRGQRCLSKTTQGYKILVVWKDGS